MGALPKLTLNLDSVARKLAEKGKEHNKELLTHFREQTALLPHPRRMLAASEAHGLAWLSKDRKEVFEACYSILVDPNARPTKSWFARHGITPMKIRAVLLGLKAWHRIACLGPNPQTIEDLLLIQDALLKPKGRGPRWSILVGLKIAALDLDSAMDSRLNLIRVPMGEMVRKGFQKTLGIKLKEDDQDYYVGLAIQGHLARLGGSNIIDINTGLHVMGQED